jgi:hypothetical protein
MNLLARLLLEISIALFFLLLALEDSLRTLRRQSGTFARIEGVVSGSDIRYPLLSEDGCNFHQYFVWNTP